MRFDFKRLFILMLIIVVVNFAATYLLAMLGVYGIISSAIVDFIIAFVIVYFNYPSHLRKFALKTTQFHYNVLMYFGILFVFTLFQWIL